MKYVLKSMLKTKAYYGYILRIILSTIIIVIDARLILWISSGFSNPDDSKYVNLVIAGSIALTVLEMFVDKIMSVTINKQFDELQRSFFEKITKSDYQMFIETSPSEILTISGNIWQINRIVQQSLNLLQNIIRVIVTIVSIGISSPVVALPLVISYLILSVIGFKLFRLWGSIDKKIDENVRVRNKEIDKIVSGFQEMRSFAMEDIHNKRFVELLGEKSSIIRQRSNVSMGINASFSFINNLTTIGLMLYFLYSIQMGSMNASSATAIIVLAWRLMDPVMSIIDFLDQLSELTSPLPKFLKIMDYENKIVDGEMNLSEFKKSIEFKNVCFHYNDSKEVLDNLSFKITKGQKIGICGTSGGGKSTIIKLIPRFYDVTNGSIRIDDVDIKDYRLSSVRDKIGIVSQDMYIFDGTIEENIKYGSPYSTIVDVIDACKKASIYNFIEELPKKFETEVGSRGIKLSGGQKQRIAIARIFLKNPDIILLDEATSALDNESETIIQESLSLFKDKTIISVAHRLSTIKDCDNILVVDNHSVIESGTHEELVELQGAYYNMLK